MPLATVRTRTPPTCDRPVPDSPSHLQTQKNSDSIEERWATQEHKAWRNGKGGSVECDHAVRDASQKSMTTTPDGLRARVLREQEARRPCGLTETLMVVVEETRRGTDLRSHI
ncbi:hypothetical protein HPB50_007489 [Hyalomma asiaticum]|uniref:Uncharacterized protein n=1 Tax=Hyalomma asiaticum TaxID=266040 RepID=A0ACB7S629_HYAAI|nr:hypothetical protein HPB50_007489 [Hyalomma asiaticum]